MFTLVREALDYYDRHHIEPAVTDKRRRRIALNHLKATLGADRIDTLDSARLAEYRAARPNIGDGTLRCEIGALISAFNFCYKNRKVKEVPYIQLPAEPAGKDRWLSYEEADHLIAKARPRARLFIKIVLDNGTRKTALEQLTWPQVDLTSRIIKLNPDGRKQTKKRRPTVPISDELYPELVIERTKAQNFYVLGSPKSIRIEFEAAVKDAGLTGVTCHTLRHTWATWAAQAGVSMWDIAGVLGITVKTAMDRYAHHSPDYLRAAVNFKKKRPESPQAASVAA